MSDVDNWISEYMKYVDRGVALIPYKRVGVWKEFFLNPTETVRKDNVSIGQRIKDLYVMTAIICLFAALVMGPMILLGTVTSAGLSLFVYGVIAAGMLILFALQPFLGLLYSLLELAVAKALGGTGDMKANFNASSLPGLSTYIIYLPLAIVAVPLAWLGMVPVIGLCASCIRFPLSLVSMGLGLYSMYLKYLAFKEVHKLSSAKAAAVVILPVFLLIALMVVIFVLIYAMIIAWFMSMMAATTAAGAASGI
ncbi:MAG: YIP1 family protein [Candidatus Micrarchaeota archaeon]